MSRTLPIQITALPTKGLLQLGGVTVTLNQEITATQLPTLTYTPNPDSNGLDSFGWNGSDGLDYATTGETVTLNLAAINDAPLLSLPTSTVTVGEDAGAQTFASFATLRPGPATATDEAGQTLIVVPTITGTTGNLAFTSAPAIDAAGNLTFQAALNTFGTATVSVVVTDSGSNTAPNVNTSTTQTFTITVNSANDQPLFTAVNPPTVNEDAGLQTVTNWATFIPGPTDEVTQTATYTISAISNPSLFTTAPTVAPNGTLTYTLAANVSGTTTFNVVVQDNGGTANGGIDTSASQTFTLTVNSVNDQPTFTAVNPAPVNEDAGLQTVPFATFNPGPADEATQTATYTVSAISNPSLFTTAPTVAPNGSLSYTLAANVSGTTTFNVTVQDSGGTANSGIDTSTTQTFTLTVNSINDRPTFTATNPAPVNEDAGLQTVTNWATFTPGPANEATQTATYTVSNISNPSLFAVAPTIAPDGTLTYTPAANAFGTTTFDVLVQDNGGTANGGVDTSLVQTFTLTINSVNDAPSFTPGANQTAVEGSGAQTVPNWVAAFNPGPANEASQTALSYTVVSVSDPSLFTAIGQPAIAPDGTLTYTPVSDLNTAGTATISVRVQDNGGTLPGVDTSAIQTFTITVNPVNDRPSFTASNPPASLEDGGVQTIPFATFNPGDPTEAAQTATYTVSNLSNAALFSVAPTIAPNGSLSYTAAPNAFGTTTFNVVVQDNGGTANGGSDTSLVQTFTLTVTPVNDRPSVTPGANQTVTAGSGVQTVASFASFNPGALNEAGQTATYTIVNNSNPGLFSAQPAIAPDGTLTYTPVSAIGTATTATLTVQVQDNGGGLDTSTTQTFTITVNPANRQPSFNASNPTPSLEDGGVQTVPFASFNPGDPTESTQTATYTVSNLTNASLFTVTPTIAPNGTLTYTAAPNAFGTATFDVVVRDNGGTANGGIDTSTTRTFTLTVNPVNDAPIVTPNANPVVTAGAGTQTIANFVSFNPGAANEAGQTATYTIVGNSNPGLFAGQPTIAPDGTLVYTPIDGLTTAQTATITVQVQDSGGTASGGLDTSATQSFTVTVNPIVTPPVIPPVIPPVTPPPSGAAVPIFTVFQLKQTFTLNAATQKLIAAQPSPTLQQLFDEEFYLRQNPDVYAAYARGVFQSGFQHFLQYGQFEGRNPSTLFNEQFYLSQNRDVAAAVTRGNFRCGFQHFLQYGQFEGRNPSTLFNEQGYLAQNSDVAAAVARGNFRSGLQHFLQFGFTEGRVPQLTLFNESYYLSQNSDVAAAVARGVFKNGLQHFEQFGQREGRQPSTLFNERYYLSQNSDVAAAVARGQFKSGFDHYLDFGRFEGRSGIG